MTLSRELRFTATLTCGFGVAVLRCPPTDPSLLTAILWGLTVICGLIAVQP